MSVEQIKKLRELLAAGPHKAVEVHSVEMPHPTMPLSYTVTHEEVREAPGATAFIQAIHELLPVVLDEIERAQGQEKQTGMALDGFVGDLERAHNAQVPTEIHCPQCNMLHVDQDEWATTRLHRKHLCHGCGHIWAPYPVTTTGVDFHVECRKRIAALEGDGVWRSRAWSDAEMEVRQLRVDNAALRVDNTTLTTRRDELLAVIAKLSQTVPLESEVAEALNQRGALLAEVGTLRARLAELERPVEKPVEKKEPYVDMRTEYDGTDYG